MNKEIKTLLEEYREKERPRDLNFLCGDVRCGSKTIYNRGFDDALELMMPMVQSLEQNESVIIENECEQCGCFSGVRYEITAITKILNDLKCKLKHTTQAIEESDIKMPRQKDIQTNGDEA